MSDSIMGYIAGYYRSRHELVLKLVEGLDDQQIKWKPNKTTPSIGFHVWHMARWADYMQEVITNAGLQIWEQEGLAMKWGFDAINLGFAETGLGMNEDISDSLPFPGKETLLAYARKAFAKADLAAGSISDSQFHRKVQDRRRTEWGEMVVGDLILGWLAHDSRHLGMIECLVGVQGSRGTATR